MLNLKAKTFSNKNSTVDGGGVKFEHIIVFVAAIQSPSLVEKAFNKNGFKKIYTNIIVDMNFVTFL